MNKIFILLYLSFIFGAFCVSLYSWKTLSVTLRLFGLLIGATFLMESFSVYCMFYTSAPRAFLYHFYVPINYSVLAYLYSTAFKPGWQKKLTLASIPVFIGVNAGLTLYVQPITEINTYASLIMCILIIALALAYYFSLLEKAGLEPLGDKPLFWISTGNLIFYAGAFFLMGFVNYLIKYAPVMGWKLMFINYALNFVLYSLYSLGFLCTTRSRKSLSL